MHRLSPGSPPYAQTTRLTRHGRSASAFCTTAPQEVRERDPQPFRGYQLSPAALAPSAVRQSYARAEPLRGAIYPLSGRPSTEPWVDHTVAPSPLVTCLPAQRDTPTDPLDVYSSLSRAITPPFMADLSSHTPASHLDYSPTSSYASCEIDCTSYSSFEIDCVSPSPTHPVVASPEPAPALYLTAEYKALADPLSAWIAQFLWTIMTHGTDNSDCAPPSGLAFLIRGVLWSTLLQPASIFLALFYLRKLPVTPLATLDSDALRYRKLIFGDHPFDWHSSLDVNPPFRVFVNIAIVANKVLDDHCFAMKTWHEISGISISELTSMEFTALAVLSHSLWIAQPVWDDWLSLLRRYHDTLEPYPSPIGSPTSESPHWCMRRAIDDVILARSLSPGILCPEAPVFLGRTITHSNLEPDIDLDEDGPLPVEYLPFRFTAPTPVRPTLPDPSKWSPRADPPIKRERPKYLPVQGRYPRFDSAAPAHNEIPQCIQHAAKARYSLPVHATAESRVPDRMQLNSEPTSPPSVTSYSSSFTRLPALSALRSRSILHALQPWPEHPPALMRPHWLKT